MSICINFVPIFFQKKTLKDFLLTTDKRRSVKALTKFKLALLKPNEDINNINIYYKSLPISLLKSRSKYDLFSPLWLQKIGRIDLTNFETKNMPFLEENDVGDFDLGKKKISKKKLGKNSTNTKRKISLGNFSEEKILSSINNVSVTVKTSTSQGKVYNTTINSGFIYITNQAKIKNFKNLNLTLKPMLFTFFILIYILLSFKLD